MTLTAIAPGSLDTADRDEPVSATVVIEVAVVGERALAAATRLAGDIHDLVVSADAGTGDVSAVLGLRLETGTAMHQCRGPAAPGPAPAGPATAVTATAVTALRMYPAPRIAVLGQTPLVLTRREFDLLLFLTERPGRVFGRPQLLELVWGREAVCGERTVDVHIRRLRAKLGPVGPVISTVRGVGYRLDRRDRVAVLPDAGSPSLH